MKRTLTLCVFVLLISATTVFGDIARPKPSSSPSEPKYLMNSTLEVVPDAKTYSGARLQLSEEAVKELREALNAGSTSQSFPNRVIGSRTNTIVAGILLFMSISFAGVWLLRSSGRAQTRGQKLAAGALIGIATLGATAMVTQGNAGPPPSYSWRGLQKNLSAGKATRGELVIEIVSSSQEVKLIIPTRNAGNADD